MSRDPAAFMKIRRVADPERDPSERVGDYGEIFGVLAEGALREQGRALHGLRRSRSATTAARSAT